MSAIEVPLNCPCPRDCSCKDNKIRFWCHAVCSTKSYINSEGDVYCEKYKTNKDECSKYFIKDAKFQCTISEENKTYEQYKSAADFLMALAQGMKAAEMKYSDNDLSQFVMKLTQSVMIKWNL